MNTNITARTPEAMGPKKGMNASAPAQGLPNAKRRDPVKRSYDFAPSESAGSALREISTLSTRLWSISTTSNR